MTKQDFIDALQKRLCGLPNEDIEERMSFYSEIIDDRIEDGLPEEEAVGGLGNLDDIVARIISDIPFIKIAKNKMKTKKRMGAWEIALLILGSPIWLSLLISAFAVMISLYAVLWSVIVSIWAVFVSLIACAIGGFAAGVILSVNGNPLSGVAIIGMAIVCGGLGIFMFFSSRKATKGVIILTKKTALGIKKCFVKKENAHE